MDGMRHTYIYDKFIIRARHPTPGIHDIDASVTWQYCVDDFGRDTQNINITAAFRCIGDAATLEHDFGTRVCNNTGQSNMHILGARAVEGDPMAISVWCIFTGTPERDDTGELPGSVDAVYDALGLLYQHVCQRVADMQPQPAYPARDSDDRECDVDMRCTKALLDFSTHEDNGRYIFDCSSRVEDYVFPQQRRHYTTHAVSMSAVLPVQLESVDVRGVNIRLTAGTVSDNGNNEYRRYIANIDDMHALIRNDLDDDIDDASPDDYHDAVESTFTDFVCAMKTALSNNLNNINNDS